MNSMDDFHENSAPPASLVKRKSAFGIGDLENHPLLKSLPPHQREVILANAKNADIDGDGDLTRDEWLCAQIQTVKDIEETAKKQAKLELTVKWGALWVVLGWLGNFALVWVVVALTQKLSPRDGNLIDSKTGEKLSTRVGSHFPAIEPHPAKADFIERRLVIQENGDNEDDLRELVESTPLGTVPLSRQELLLQFEAFVDGHSVVVELEQGQTTFFFNVHAVSSFTKGEGTTCDLYHDVDVTNSGNQYTVTVECCENDSHCDYYANYDSARLDGEGRRLKACVESC
jgi:hypothetical protein